MSSDEQQFIQIKEGKEMKGGLNEPPVIERPSEIKKPKGWGGEDKEKSTDNK